MNDLGSLLTYNIQKLHFQIFYGGQIHFLKIIETDNLTIIVHHSAFLENNQKLIKLKISAFGRYKGLYFN